MQSAILVCFCTHAEYDHITGLQPPMLCACGASGQAHRGRQGEIRSLAEPWADTGTSTGRLMLAVLGGLADVERDLIRTRTAEGRSRAKARGRQMGRPPALTPAQQKKATHRRARGAPLHELARSYNVGMSTFEPHDHPVRPHKSHLSMSTYHEQVAPAPAAPTVVNDFAIELGLSANVESRLT
jgi:hypothetical protein